MSAPGRKRSRAALRAILAEDDSGTGIDMPDPRAFELGAIGAEDPAALQVIREVFAGTGLPDDQEKVRRLLRVRSEVHKEWGDARDSFVAIGRALLALEFELTKAEFARLRQSSERLFPFSDATATQLRQIARAIDSGRIPVQACPGSYGTAYQITLLSEAQMRIAWQRGLIRPDVTRREILQLRREILIAAAEPEPPGRLDRTLLGEERAKLAERRARLIEELAAVERRLAQLEGLLSPLAVGDAECQTAEHGAASAG